MFVFIGAWLVLGCSYHIKHVHIYISGTSCPYLLSTLSFQPYFHVPIMPPISIFHFLPFVLHSEFQFNTLYPKSLLTFQFCSCVLYSNFNILCSIFQHTMFYILNFNIHFLFCEYICIPYTVICTPYCQSLHMVIIILYH